MHFVGIALSYTSSTVPDFTVVPLFGCNFRAALGEAVTNTKLVTNTWLVSFKIFSVSFPGFSVQEYVSTKVPLFEDIVI